MRIKHFFLCLIICLFLLSGLVLLLQPKTSFKISDTFDKWNADLIRTFFQDGRFWLDSCFKDKYDSKLTCKLPLDIVIPLVEKDIITARKVIEGVRAMVKHPISAIYIVAPERKPLIEFAHEMKCEFIPEHTVVPEYDTVRKFGGWILQQFIKLNCDSFTKNENILVIDADTILLRPQVLIDDKKDIYTFHIHSDYSSPRKEFTQRLLKENTYFKLDFVSHHMVFKREWLHALKQYIEKVQNKKWYDAIVELLEIQNKGFSEYDIYATYVFLNHRSQTKILSSANTFIYRDKFQYLEIYRPVLAPRYKSLSCHHFMTLE